LKITDIGCRHRHQVFTINILKVNFFPFLPFFPPESKSRNWLSESDVDFFTGGGPSEAAGSTGSSDADIEAGVVQRRLLIGIGASAALGAFALVPTEKLQPAPSKPLFFYLVPLLRVQGLLVEAEKIIPVGDYEQLRRVLERIEGPPNNVQENLRKAAACKY
jgi:hypothetical protein